MGLEEKKLIELYRFAIAYAKVCRTYLIEVDDAVQEMMIVALKLSDKPEKYIRQSMRNRYLNLLRRGKLVARYHVSGLDNLVSEPYEDPVLKREAKNLLEQLFKIISKDQTVRLKKIGLGFTEEEMGVSRMTVWRTLKRARETLKSLDCSSF